MARENKETITQERSPLGNKGELENWKPVTKK